MALPRIVGDLRRAGPEIVLALVVVFAGVSLWQWWAIASHLRSQARDTSRIYGRITAAIADSSPGADTETLFTLVSDITASGIPMVVTDVTGRPTAVINLPFEADETDPRVRDVVRELDRQNAPITVAGVGELHYGALPAARRLTGLAVFQLGLLATAVAVGIWAYRTAVGRDRERLWIAMARESAHQLGTPLMSAGAWVDRLGDGVGSAPEIAEHLRSDLERLHRVAQRFERIGRPARRDRVALGAVAERVAAYFAPRLPRHAHAVDVRVHAPETGPTIAGDAVLIEWAVEAMLRNAVDALSGRGGTITITVSQSADHVTLEVADDGPGIAPEVRARLFEPGVSTKPGGWGIGLALAKRIVEDVHGGRLDNPPTSRGARFVAQLPAHRDGQAAVT